MDPGWYYQVGATFILYMIINIFTPHLNALITWLIKKCKRWLDGGICNCGKRRTKKKTKKEYIDLHTGPEFNIGLRYSQILTTTFAILVYSSGLPILYICCFFYFLITYWIDKWLMLRFYRNPPHIDLYVSNIFTLIILFGVIVHFSFAIWIYGNGELLTDSSTSALSGISSWIKQYLTSSGNTFAAEILTRISYSYNVLILFFLAIIVLLFIMRIFYIDRLIYACFSCCDADMQKVKDVNIYDGKTYF
jgi:hypothetical protein